MNHYLYSQIANDSWEGPAVSVHRRVARVSDPQLGTADILSAQLVQFERVLGRAWKDLSNTQRDGLQSTAFAILAALITEGPQRTSAVSSILHAEISTISRQISALVQRGLIERQADPDDGRACLLTPTEKGRNAFDCSRIALGRWLFTMVRDWESSETEQLITLLDRLSASLVTHDLDSVR